MTASSGAAVHPTAVVEDGASLGDGVRIGAYSVIGPEVALGDGVHIDSHVVVTGVTTLGPRVRVYPFSSIGQPPQDLKYAGERTELTIGADTQIREHVTMNTGTGEGGVTRVGERCLFMPGAHVAHDCQVGNSVIAANNATLAGHVTVGDFVILGGLSAVHQHVRIGPHVMVGGLSGVGRDVIPFGMIEGRGRLTGLNLIGLKRRGFDRATIQALREAFETIFRGADAWADRVARAREAHGGVPAVREVVDFLTSETNRHFSTPEEY